MQDVILATTRIRSECPPVCRSIVSRRTTIGSSRIRAIKHIAAATILAPQVGAVLERTAIAARYGIIVAAAFNASDRIDCPIIPPRYRHLTPPLQDHGPENSAGACQLGL